MNERVERLIKTAVIAAAEYEADYLSSLPTPDVTFSEGFEQKIREIKDGEFGNVKPRISPKRWVAILIAAALLLALTITAVAHRDGISNLIESIFEGHNDYDAPFENAGEIETYVLPTYLPEGYTEYSSIQDSNFVCWVWQNGNKNIEFKYGTGGDIKISVSTEGNAQGEFVTNGLLVKTFSQNSMVTLLWDDGKCVYILSCPEELGQAEFEKIIRSIAPVEG